MLKVKSKKLKVAGGQSLFEVVVALAISAIIITAIVALVTTSIRNSTYSKNESLASAYGQALTEWLRQERDQGTDEFHKRVNPDIPGASSTWCFPILGWVSPVRATFGTTPVCDPSNVDDHVPGTKFLRQAIFSVKYPASESVAGKILTIIEAKVQVIWTDSQGDHTVESVTSFSDWRQR